MGSILCEQCAFQCSTCTLDSKNCKICINKIVILTIKVIESKYLNVYVNLDTLMIQLMKIVNNVQVNVSNVILMDVYLVLLIEYQMRKWIVYLHLIQFGILILLGAQLAKLQLLKSIYLTILAKLLFILIFLWIQKDLSRIAKIFELTIISTQQMFIILQLFEQSTVQSFGQNAVCYLNPKNNQELLIQLGESSTINVGDEILFISMENFPFFSYFKIRIYPFINRNSMSHIDCENSLQKFIFTTLEMPVSPLLPKIEYNVPLHKLNPFAENSINLNSLKNYGFRKLNNLEWRCEVVGNEDAQTLQEFLNYTNLLQEYNLLIPQSIINKIFVIQNSIKI